MTVGTVRWNSVLSATNPKALSKEKAHKAQALRRVDMPELVRGKTGNCRALEVVPPIGFCTPLPERPQARQRCI